MSNLVLNPNSAVVQYVRSQVKQNNGYCIFEQTHTKSTKCPKACKKNGNCSCGMYISDDYEPEQFDLD